MDLLLTGAMVYDGTGAPGRIRDIGVDRGRIVLDPDSATAASRVIDASAKVLCPGFVDIHTHSDLTLLSGPDAKSKIRQGVTTEVIGNCGLGVAPLPADGSADAIRQAVAYLDLDPSIMMSWTDIAGQLAAVQRVRPAVNVASFVGHLPVHAMVAGFGDAVPNAQQLDRMTALVDDALGCGAVGLSTGLVYAPLTEVQDKELVALGRVVAARDRLFAWHVRDYADHLLPSIRQAIGVAEQAGCRLQISHLTAVGRRNWGMVKTVLAEVDTARERGVDIGIDIYPYLAGNAPLSQLMPGWAQRDGSEAMSRRLAEPSARVRVLEGWADAYWDWADIRINAIVGPDVDEQSAAALGRTIAEIAVDRDCLPGEVAIELVARWGSAVSMVAHGRSEEDLVRVLSHRATVVASDGQALDPDGPTGAAGLPHPRSYGCFPRYLNRFAAGDLADGIRRCTSAPADRVGLTDRGRIADGAPADLVVFDPNALADNATFVQPQQFATGIELVVVNGQVVLADGAATGVRPGRILKPSA